MKLNFKNWFESAIDFGQYDLQKKYDYYNELLFGGELPKIPIEYANLKAGGIVRCKVVMDPNNMPNPMAVRMGIQDKYHGAKIVDGTHRMQISKIFKKSEQGLDAILIHEMLHVYFNVNGQFGEQHGIKFSKMAKAIGEKVGFEIPLTDNIERHGLADDIKIKSIGVQINYKKDGNKSIALMSEKTMTAMLEALVARWRQMIDYSYAVKSEFYIIKSSKWTELAHSYPLQRRAPKDLSYYILKDESALDDLKKNGKLLATVESDDKLNALMQRAHDSNKIGQQS